MWDGCVGWVFDCYSCDLRRLITSVCETGLFDWNMDRRETGGRNFPPRLHVCMHTFICRLCGLKGLRERIQRWFGSASDVTSISVSSCTTWVSSLISIHFLNTAGCAGVLDVYHLSPVGETWYAHRVRRLIQIVVCMCWVLNISHLLTCLPNFVVISNRIHRKYLDLGIPRVHVTIDLLFILKA